MTITEWIEDLIVLTVVGTVVLLVRRVYLTFWVERCEHPRAWSMNPEDTYWHCPDCHNEFRKEVGE